MDFFVKDGMHEKDYIEARDKARASVLRMMGGTPLLDSDSFDYDSNEQYGSSNDTFGPPMDSGPPLPFIDATEQTDDGYIGLMPPMGT